MYPQLPANLTPPANLEIDLDELWNGICTELVHNDYFNRTHGNRRTYDAGCHGPVCGKSARVHARRRTSTVPSERYRYIDPIIDWWYEVARSRLDAARTALLEQIKTA